MATKCILPQLEFQAFGSRKAVGDFEGAAQFRGRRAAAARSRPGCKDLGQQEQELVGYAWVAYAYDSCRER